MRGSGDFAAEVERLPEGAVVIRVEGELDMATSPVLEERIAESGPCDRLVLDLTGCTFVDSAAVRLLTTTAREAQTRGGHVAVAANDPGVLRILEITALGDVLSVYPTVGAALG